MTSRKKHAIFLKEQQARGYAVTLAEKLRKTQLTAIQQRQAAEIQRQKKRGESIDRYNEDLAQSIVEGFLKEVDSKLQAAAAAGESRIQVCRYYHNMSNDHFGRVQELLAPFCAENGLRTQVRYDVGFSDEQKGVYVTWADASD